MNPYVIDGGQAGKERLRLLAEVMAPTTGRLLDRLGLRPGMACLDAGCGGGDVTLEMARRVGPTGRVVGLDFDRAILRLAEADAIQAGAGTLSYRWADAENLSSELAAFDLVYARFLLSHLRRPDRALAGMVAAAKAGAWVAVEDVDFEGHFCHPSCPAFARYVGLYQAVVRRKGADPTLGRKLPALLLDAGLHNVQLDVVQPAFREGPGKRLADVTLARIAATVIVEGLANAAEIAAMQAELQAFAADERTVLSMPRIVQCWGQKAPI